ncbi:MAG: lysophospholipid acyltransferase family protein [Thermoanaerobaculia bacterium]
MQWKIARSGAFSEKLNRWAIDRGFPLLAWLAPRAPRWFLFFGARATMAVVFFFHSQPLLAIGRNLARVLEKPADSREVRRAVREMLCHFAYYWVDLFRFAQLPPERLRSLIVGGDLASIDPLRRLRDAGERILLLTAHLGNWELGAVMLGGAELPLSVVYVRDEFEQAERFRSLLRGRADVQEIPIRPDDRFASLPVLRAFAERRLVALQGDRDFNEAHLEIELFGAPTRLPTGPFQLARMTRARLQPVFIAYADDHRFEVALEPLIDVGQTDDRDADIRTAMETWARVLERNIRRWPTQWYNFHDVWPGGPGEDES